jgi:hypothetical protein
MNADLVQFIIHSNIHLSKEREVSGKEMERAGRWIDVFITGQIKVRATTWHRRFGEGLR